jgi:large subunit ribosomal protein L1
MIKRSKKYLKNREALASLIAKNGSEVFEVEKAVEILQGLEKSNFKIAETVEIHFKLAINPTRSDQLVRSSVVLPNGTGKEVKIAAFVNPQNVELVKKLGVYRAGSDDLIEEIKTSGNVDFDKAIAEPDVMKKLPPIARVLGTAGVMPNPKTGTVGENLEEMINLIKNGKVDFRNDKSGNLHFSVGKLSFENAKLIANILEAIDAVEKAKPEALKKKYVSSIHICSTMSPSIRIR